MAKLFIQTLPSKEELRASASKIHDAVDSQALYANLLFMKVANDLENYLDSLLAPHNLSSGRFTLLILLGDAPEGMMPSELSNRVGVTQATISGLINGLEKAELVKRELHEKDGRSFVIKITDKGQALVKEIFPQWAPKISTFWNQINNEELNSFSGILENMVKSTGVLTK
ncbi:MarR family winged helix-turn-helix transcriptional regulator [Bdellovibrio bacteriovorus]|uniref:Transcriptional regulator n=1 Tax=Bdellovibrio bacteriovorus TaxID=959 RepID=A0A150WGC7_BDEBC|nr:MarR family transcriptional regulator [Bdellovibrio bacteriovorus]KYG62030.1 transcriptional regulator [Bdellovibrio bacteriovorus]